ncbi:MAG: acyl-CoA thioesterase [Fibrobacteres bacterium]|nr:acyl-CoA thioesterase [Fibrobacterota bacterium]
MPEPIEKQPASRVAIRFQDCDPFGHLNNAKYLEYFINAREDHLKLAYGFDLFAKGRETGCSWVVARHQIAYLAPANCGEEVLIKTSLRRYTDQGAMVESRMHNAADTRLKTLLWTDYVFVRLDTGRPAKHPADILAFLESVHLSEEGFPAEFSARERALAIKILRDS